MLEGLNNVLSGFTGGNVAPNTPSSESWRKEVEDKIQMEQELKLKQDKQKYDEEQARLKREYETPKEQMKRYIEAGINPYMQQFTAGEFTMTNSGDTASLEETMKRGFEGRQGTNVFNDVSSMIGLVNQSVTAMSQISDAKLKALNLSDYETLRNLKVGNAVMDLVVKLIMAFIRTAK